MRALKKQNKVDSTRDQCCQEFKAFKGSTQLTQVEPHFLPLTVQKVKRLAQLTCSQVGLISSTGRSGLEPMTHPLRDSWKGRLCTRFIRDTSPAYYEDWPAMLRTHCIGDGWTRDLVGAVFNYTLRDCFGYAIASFIGYSSLCRKLRKFSHKTVPQCNLTENQRSLTHNLRIACTILVSSAAILLVSALQLWKQEWTHGNK